MHIASCVKVVQSAMLITGKNQEQADRILDIFVESFINNLDFQKNENLNLTYEDVLEEFRPGQNWTEKMAGIYRAEGLIMDEAIYNSHIGNEEFYDKVAALISERMRSTKKDKGKDGFSDCIDDDKTKLSTVQVSTHNTRSSILGNKNIEHTNDEQNQNRGKND